MFNWNERAGKRIYRLKVLFVHLVATLVIAIGVRVAMDRFNLSRDVEAVIPAAILLFVAHALWVMYQEARNMILQQETERLRVESLSGEKPKRQQFRIGDDGELVETTDWVEETQPQKPKRSR